MMYELDIGGAFREYNAMKNIDRIIDTSRKIVDGRLEAARDRRRRMLRCVTAPLWGPLYVVLIVLVWLWEEVLFTRGFLTLLCWASAVGSFAAAYYAFDDGTCSGGGLFVFFVACFCLFLIAAVWETCKLICTATGACDRCNCHCWG